tara:strand:+ start:1806 stop:2981 length:1176 start_codon:yes stop_codon:yes gene_type:complete
LQTTIIFLFQRVIKLNKLKKIFICTTEQSGDNISYNICKKLIKYNYQIDGVCGNLSESFFNKKFYDIKIFKSLGFIEIIFSIPKFIKIINDLSAKIIENNYDLVICIDSPDFNYQLAKKIKKNNYKNKTIQIVAPTVWAWRKGRAKKFAKVFDELFTLFNFENKYFDHVGLKTTFIGHPVSIIKSYNYYDENEKNLIAFLPGSRENEINKLFTYYNFIHDYIYKIDSKKKYSIFIPTLPHLEKKLLKLTKDWKINIILSTNNDHNETLYKKVFISITCSGTATLEISKRLIPQIILYKLNILTYFIFKLLVKVKYANIINILNNKMIIEELVNTDLTIDNLLKSFDKLYFDKEFRFNQIKNIKNSLKEIDNNQNPYDICYKRISEIISKAI